MNFREFYYRKDGKLNKKGKELSRLFNVNTGEGKIIIKDISTITFVPYENSKNFEKKTFTKTFGDVDELKQFLRDENASSYKEIMFNKKHTIRACDVFVGANYK